MRLFLFFSFILFGYSHAAFAQQKTFTLEEATLGLRGKLAPNNLKDLQWVPGTNNYSYLDGEKDGVTLNLCQLDGKTINVVDLKTLKMKSDEAKFSSLESFPSITWESSDAFTYVNKGEWLRYSVKENKLNLLVALDKDAENSDFDTKSGRIAFTRNNNLFVMGKEGEILITNDVNRDIINGQSVHRNEFGIKKGTFWSPKGNLLAFYRMDQTMVTDYPLINWKETPAKNNNIKYPFSGNQSHEVTIKIYNFKEKKILDVKTEGPREQYLTNIAWSPDEKHIYIAVLNREQNIMKLNSYDASTGAFEKTILEEKDGKYVEPLNPMMFIGDNGNQFIWQSRKDGWNHLYLYDLNGKLIKQLTKGNWEVVDVVSISENLNQIFFSSTVGGPLSRHLSVVNLKDGKTIQLTKGDGMHTCSINSTGALILDNYQALHIPREIKLIDNKGKEIKTILKADNPLKEYLICQTQLTKIKAKDGEDLYCRLYKPANFDSTKSYPAIIYLYGGPHAQMIQNNWITSREGWFQFMAQRGYVIFTIDNHGSELRGKIFEQATFRRLGSVEMDDQILGVEFLRMQRYVDMTRIGVHGWSFGGFLTTSLMTRRPEIFKVGVAGGPVIDWSLYEIMYTERYMDTPQLNPEGYGDNNLLNHIDKLRGKLLMIHGTDDDVVVWQHSLKFVQKSVELGKQVDYFVYPGHKHNVLGKDRVHLMQKITDYFLQNL